MGVDSGDGEPTIVEVDSETDSQARNAAFQEFVGCYRQTFDGDRSLRELRSRLVPIMKELGC